MCPLHMLYNHCRTFVATDLGRIWKQVIIPSTAPREGEPRDTSTSPTSECETGLRFTAPRRLSLHISWKMWTRSGFFRDLMVRCSSHEEIENVWKQKFKWSLRRLRSHERLMEGETWRVYLYVCHQKDIAEETRIILIFALKKWVVAMRTGFIWLKLATSGEFLLTWRWAIRFHRGGQNSWLRFSANTLLHGIIYFAERIPFRTSSESVFSVKVHQWWWWVFPHFIFLILDEERCGPALRNCLHMSDTSFSC
jgi:hypothetical protein